MESFHPSCYRLYNSAKELVPCTSKVEIFTAKGGNLYENGKSVVTANERSQVTGSIIDDKINRIYKLLIEMREEVISRGYIKQVIAKVVNEEMDKIRKEIQQWKTTKALMGRAVRGEMQSIKNVAATLSDGTNKNTYSQVVKNQSVSVLIVKPKGEENSKSEDTKREIKIKLMSQSWV